MVVTDMISPRFSKTFSNVLKRVFSFEPEVRWKCKEFKDQ